MQNPTPEDDWVSEEAEALLNGTPGLREELREAVADHRAGTLKTVDTSTVRSRLEARIKTDESR
jgi:hypothetical protein